MSARPRLAPTEIVVERRALLRALVNFVDAGAAPGHARPDRVLVLVDRVARPCREPGGARDDYRPPPRKPRRHGLLGDDAEADAGEALEPASSSARPCNSIA